MFSIYRDFFLFFVKYLQTMINIENFTIAPTPSVCIVLFSVSNLDFFVKHPFTSALTILGCVIKWINNAVRILNF